MCSLRGVEQILAAAEARRAAAEAEAEAEAEAGAPHFNLISIYLNLSEAAVAAPQLSRAASADPMPIGACLALIAHAELPPQPTHRFRW